VFKGLKLPGHMGAETITVRNLDIVKIDAEQNLLIVKGAVPGGKVLSLPSAWRRARGLNSRRSLKMAKIEIKDIAARRSAAPISPTASSASSRTPSRCTRWFAASRLRAARAPTPRSLAARSLVAARSRGARRVPVAHVRVRPAHRSGLAVASSSVRTRAATAQGPNKVVSLRCVRLSRQSSPMKRCSWSMASASRSPRRSSAAAILRPWDHRRVTIVVPDDDINAMLSFRNIAKVRVIAASEANTYDLVDNAALLFAKPALTWLEGVLS